ncbi:MAG: sugar nucleotide-binding protein [Methylicorpusculum sp.]|uniref:NAD-dependent epimerase/dehydratase family protein n=1 Tax=Methylicorpusculum sp. TaxID=2713644 RepID=UPI0027305409|nr:NAD-dependent epimerase/dehydratase family protein [Methylicorpusculum sp.]MDP2203193.1 sugar nucleotide-binding protein [Methylicorpusculum sp.]
MIKVVITGATGYIGTRLTALATSRGYEVVGASRQRPGSHIASWLHFDLSSNDALVLPDGTDVVVHLAADTAACNLLDDVGELAAAQRLIASAQKVGARFIFVSSQTAHAEAPTLYGRTKWRIEQEVLAVGGWVVRPGQVYGGELRGLYGTLVMAVQKLPLLPEFIPSPKVQPIHLNDLAEGLLRIAERGDAKPGLYCLAAPVPISFSTFLAEIAKSRLRCKRIFLPVPVVVINFFAAVIGSAFRTKLGVERLRSLFDLPVMATTSDLDQLRLVLRPLPAGLHPSGDDRRRRLLREGQVLLTYVLKEQPGSALLRRYVRAIESLREGRVFGLPGVFLNYPILLSLLGKTSWQEGELEAEFIWRLDAATMLSEASPAGAARFLGLGGRHSLLISLLLITNALMGEAFWRLARVIVSPMLRLGMARAKGVS